MAHGKWTEVEARGVLEAWRKSGVPLERFATERGLVGQRLRWWRLKLAASDNGAVVSTKRAFLPVKTPPLRKLLAEVSQ